MREQTGSGFSTGSRHIVQFYETEASLVERAATYLAEGTVAGQALVVLATASHARAIADALAAKAPAAEAFIHLDTDKLMPALTAGALPIDELMRRRVELALSAAGVSEHASIRYYGRLADQLMTSGNAEASLAVEDFWSSFIATRDMCILCAHSLENFYQDETGYLLNEVCVRHGAADPGV